MSDEVRRKSGELLESDQPVEAPARRSFLAVVIAASLAVFAALASIPLIRFALYPLFAKTSETEWSEVGPAASFESLSSPVEKLVAVTQRDGWRQIVSQRPVYVTRDKQGHLQVLSAVCPHLGCEVPWSPERQEFFCPCHGSAFAPDGSRIAGPAPRGLDSLATAIQNGQLKVRYQYFRQLLPYKEVAG
jgi:menaquinol-cytochrome c reductase iron-sulfur subunit